ncbi:hypothetical protein ACIBSV_15390 [Embleya sp. NPDC050154]|uniref:hypothetical protein n=1 Tax=Embleya sp. NPDC050154 TaxID=3363988 RepID=UPI00379F2C0D
MKTIVNDRVVFTTAEFAESALGVDWALFDGEPGETTEERAARLDAARDILADLWARDRELARHAEDMFEQLWLVDPGTAVCAELLLATAAAPVVSVEGCGAVRAA